MVNGLELHFLRIFNLQRGIGETLRKEGEWQRLGRARYTDAKRIILKTIQGIR